MAKSKDTTSIMNTKSADRFISMNEVAQVLSVPISTLRKWREKDRMPFPAYLIGPRSIRFKMSEVLEWANSKRHLNSAQAYELHCE